jgi:hypothetical protein
MPVVRVPTAGSEIIASATVTQRRRFTLAGGAQLLTSNMALQVNNLPNVFIYVLQTAGGVPGLTVTPLFAVDNTVTGGAVAPYWLELAPAQAIFPAVPQFFNFRVIANMITCSVSNTAGVDITFDCVVAASQ